MILKIGFLFLFSLFILSHSLETTDETKQVQGSKLNKENVHEELKKIIGIYFKDCHLNQTSNLPSGCSIQKQKYPIFLYSIYQKDLMLRFLKLYQTNGKLIETKEDQIQKIYQNIQLVILNAFRDWSQIQKVNEIITVEQMYRDLLQIYPKVLDIIKYKQDIYGDLINVMRQVQKFQRGPVQKFQRGPKRYYAIGNKKDSQVDEDIGKIMYSYFGNCSPNECKMPLSRYVYFVRELTFYVTPVFLKQQNVFIISVSEQQQFAATKFLIDEVQNLRPIIGEQVDMKQAKKYMIDLAKDLINFLESKKQKTLIQNQRKQQAFEDMNQSSGEL